MSDERVLVVPRADVPDIDGWHGVHLDGVPAFLDLVTREGRFEAREAMERDPAFKQVIPYLVLRDGPRYFLMRRTRAGGDTRLHDRWSIGVGGHLNPGDLDVFGGLRREWHEELDAAFEPDFRPVALLNDDSTAVGAVHIGVIVVADAAGRSVRVRETDKLEGGFVDAAQVRAVADRLETWSALVFEALESGVLAGTRTEATP